MKSILDLLASIILAPFKLIRFIVLDVLVYGIIGGIVSFVAALVKGTFRLIFRPFTLLLIGAGAAAFYFATEEQKKKVKALMGM
ncbi:MAG TPA: hypothetical protein PLP82_01020 [Deltaproteobacteria bacterium]|jgi:hypothetical protein|nr:hypothetical protein [Deltaproteobacteria bacterium]NMD40673.1 hypothetical protein [Deltaproteobacteria bacterium]HNQ84858.1 hypothetical protein [Deltaproteobacteria bacterium]HNS89742.1 hypothetical protein [Deltaproteobacteria bacterium]HOA44475.1 hypothetical protein [Deltaproteobacteria bacterium]